MVPAAVWSESKTAGAGVSAVLRMSSARTMQFTLSDDDEAREALGMVRSGDRLVLRPAIPAAPDLQHHLRLQVTRVSNDEQAGRGTTVTVEVEDGQLIPASEITAYLVYGNSEKWVAAREALPQARGLISGIVFVLRLSVRSIVPSVLTLVTHRAAPQHPLEVLDDARGRRGRRGGCRGPRRVVTQQHAAAQAPQHQRQHHQERCQRPGPAADRVSLPGPLSRAVQRRRGRGARRRPWPRRCPGRGAGR